MTPWKHAESSARKFGGLPKDYIEIHEWFDSTKQYTGDWTHRALRHHAAGIQWAIEKFGHTFRCSASLGTAGICIPVKLIAEQHIMEDCGFIPTVSDWTSVLATNPEPWMLKVKTKTTKDLSVKDEPEPELHSD